MRRRSVLIPIVVLVVLLHGGAAVGATTCGGGFSRGGDGRDTIHADDRMRDIIDCGRGSDTVYFDKGKDVLSNCEHKFPS